MPSLIDIRRRVRAVKSTQQITKAMKMVSSSKLRRAQERIVRSRPYAKEMLRVFNNLATRVDSSKHPLLNDDPQSGRTLLIVITADRGLCGSFNTNVIKSSVQFTLDQPKGPQGQDVALALVGRKGRDFFMRRGFDVKYEEVGLFQNVKWSHAQAIAKTCIAEFLGPPKFRYGEIDADDQVGVVTGLAWTEVGGELLQIEAVLVPGRGRVSVTGKLGDVMQESAQAAMSYVRSRWQRLGLTRDFYRNLDLHIAPGRRVALGRTLICRLPRA